MQQSSILLKCVGSSDKCGEVNEALGLGGYALVGLFLEVAVHRKSGACGDELADDDVLLQADKVIDLALDGSLGEDLCGLLEGCRRQEALGCQRRLCDTHEKLGIGCLGKSLLACRDSLVDLAVCGFQLADINGGAGQKLGASRILYPDLAHHLTHNDLDMLIVDINALLTVDLLNLLDDIGADTGTAKLIVVYAAYTQNIVRTERAAGQLLTLVDVRTGLDKYACRVRNRVDPRVALGLVDDADCKQRALLRLLNGDCAGDLGQDSHFLGLARLKQLLNTGKTLRDIIAGDAAGVEVRMVS